MGPKKKKDKVPPLELPIEDVDLVKMDFDKLVQHGVKVADELNRLKKERTTLEIERDKMCQYWDTAIFQLLKIERDIRHLERKTLSKGFEGDRALSRKQKELQNKYFENGKEWEEKRISLLKNIYDSYEYNFIKQEQLFKDSFDLNKDRFMSIHEQDLGRARARIETHSKAMDEAIEKNFLDVKELEDKNEYIFGHKYELLYNQTNKDMSSVIARKEMEIRTFQIIHKNMTKEILEVFENVTKHNCSLISNLSMEINEFKRSEMIALKKFSEVKKEYNLIAETITYGTREVVVLKRELQNIDIIQNKIRILKDTYKEKEKYRLILNLKLDLLEDTVEQQKLFLKEAKSCTIECLLDLREKQTKIHVWLQMIIQHLEKRAQEIQELIERCLGKKFSGYSWLKTLHDDFHDIRLTTIDVLTRCLELQNYQVDNLGFKINIDLGIRKPIPPRMEEQILETDDQIEKEPSECSETKMKTNRKKLKFPKVHEAPPLICTFYDRHLVTTSNIVPNI